MCIRDRYDVILFDQAGGGFSDYIDLNDYSMKRFVDDIECIRKNLKLNKMILVGQSFGARIASYYALLHKDHVESIIYAGAAGLSSHKLKDNIRDRKALKKQNIEFASGEDTEFKPKLSEMMRFVLSVLLCKIGGQNIVSQLVSQKEITEYSTRMIPDAIARAYHKKYKHLIPPITSGGISVLINVLMHNDYDKLSINLINQLRGSELPVLILRSAYDYVPWKDTKFYREIFTNHYLTYIPESGHIAWSVNKTDTYNSMINFMNKDYQLIDIYHGEENPVI